MQLNSTIEEIFTRLPESKKKGLKKIGVKTISDLLYYFPSRYGSIDEIKNTKNIQKGDKIIIYAKVKKIKPTKTYYKKITMTEATLEDNEGIIQAIWFRQPYIAKILPEGTLAKFSGTISERKGKLYLANPKYEITKNIASGIFEKKTDSHFLIPIYPESRGVSSQWIYYSLQKILVSKLFKELKDPIPKEILKKYNLPSLKTALIWIHSPKKQSDTISARKRFAFEEIFFIQLLRQKQKETFKKLPSFKIKKTKEEIKKLLNSFSFELTQAQEKAIKQILKDIGSNYPMSRLLEGDVGSGKTAVAAIVSNAVVTTKPDGQNFGNLQVAYMSPTEVLSKQLFESFIQYFSSLNINIGLITSSGCKKFPSKTDPEKWTNISRPQLLKWVANGEIPILIGTHSLIQKSIKFKNLALVIIDEQHRFGINQRQKMISRENNLKIPHLLSMTATPIPRTLALTIYGDLDLTLLNQMPKGRKPIITEVVTPQKREQTYTKIKKELEKGRQMYVVCPRINEPDPNKANVLRVKSVKSEAKKLKKEIFPKYEIDILHSKMKPTDKEYTMEEFENGKINILVSTSVIEVGVNIPNATIIIIEGAERFGLAQLHQLRGRVLRSNHQSYCYIFSDTKAQQTLDRLNAIKTAKNGFELAELDLMLRGSGELSGKKQWGISDLGMEAIKNIKMVEAARSEAQKMIEKDVELKKFGVVRNQLEKTKIHFE